MSNYLGFEPTEENPYYFVSYNNDEAEYISDLVVSMHQAGIPLWYDYGIVAGEEWSCRINEKIAGSQGLILFLTKGVLQKEKSYAQREYKIAQAIEKRIIVIVVDQINKDDVPIRKIDWWIELQEKQWVPIYRLKEQKAKIEAIAKEFGIKKTAVSKQNTAAPNQQPEPVAPDKNRNADKSETATPHTEKKQPCICKGCGAEIIHSDSRNNTSDSRNIYCDKCTETMRDCLSASVFSKEQMTALWNYQAENRKIEETSQSILNMPERKRLVEVRDTIRDLQAEYKQIEAKLANMSTEDPNLKDTEKRKREIRIKAALSKKEFDELKADYDIKSKDSWKDLEAHRAKAAEHSKTAGPFLMEKYTEIKKSTPNPIARITGSQCSECHNAVSSFAIRLIKKGTLMKCHHCGRILIEE